MPKASRRSPLRATPLRHAGDSVQDEIDHWREGVFLDRLVVVLIVLSMWTTALIQLLFPTAPRVSFAVMSVILIAALMWSIPAMVRALTIIKRLRLGRDGERAVAEYLELVAQDGFRVVHDLRGDGFNIDHVLVGTQGVFTIETKTLSKPLLGDVRVRYDGATIHVDGVPLDRDPLVQARAQAAWLRRRLEDLTGQRYPIRSVVVFPGWFVERTQAAASSPIWVLEPKELRGWLSREPHMLPRHAVHLIVDRLKKLARYGT